MEWSDDLYHWFDVNVTEQLVEENGEFELPRAAVPILRQHSAAFVRLTVAIP